MLLPPGLSENSLLAAVPALEVARLADELELVPLALGEMLYGPGGQLQHAYFPTTSIISLHYVTESGASAEIAGVGNEGVVGVSLFMEATPRRVRPSCKPPDRRTGWSAAY